MTRNEDAEPIGFVSIGFHAGPTATAYVINTADGSGEPLLSITDDSRWITLSSGVRNEGSRAHVDFARMLASAAATYLAAVERFAAEQGTIPPPLSALPVAHPPIFDSEESPDATPGVDDEVRS